MQPPVNDEFAEDGLANEQYDQPQALVTIDLMAGFDNLDDDSDTSSSSDESDDGLLAGSVHSDSDANSDDSEAERMNRAVKLHPLGHAPGYFTRSRARVAKLLKWSEDEFDQFILSNEGVTSAAAEHLSYYVNVQAAKATAANAKGRARDINMTSLVDNMMDPVAQATHSYDHPSGADMAAFKPSDWLAYAVYRYRVAMERENFFHDKEPPEIRLMKAYVVLKTREVLDTDPRKMSQAIAKRGAHKTNQQ